MDDTNPSKNNNHNTFLQFREVKSAEQAQHSDKHSVKRIYVYRPATKHYEHNRSEKNHHHHPAKHMSTPKMQINSKELRWQNVLFSGFVSE